MRLIIPLVLFLGLVTFAYAEKSQLSTTVKDNWVIPEAKASHEGISAGSTNESKAESFSGDYETNKSFKEVVAFYAKKDKLLKFDENEILKRDFPGDKINMPGHWSGGHTGGTSTTILHHIRPTMASATFLVSNNQTGEIISVVITRAIDDKTTHIQLSGHHKVY